MIYDEHQGGMLCSVCTKYGKPPVQARGAWVTRAINNWPKATNLLKKHESSEWHGSSGGTRDGFIRAKDW